MTNNCLMADPRSKMGAGLGDLATNPELNPAASHPAGLGVKPPPKKKTWDRWTGASEAEQFCFSDSQRCFKFYTFFEFRIHFGTGDSPVPEQKGENAASGP